MQIRITNIEFIYPDGVNSSAATTVNVRFSSSVDEGSFISGMIVYSLTDFTLGMSKGLDVMVEQSIVDKLGAV